MLMCYNHNDAQEVSQSLKCSREFHNHKEATGSLTIMKWSHLDVSHPDVSDLYVSHPDLLDLNISHTDVSHLDVSHLDASNTDFSNQGVSYLDISH